ncbi:class I SAM-dependent methyltransferase [Candidatus Woesearchaeota archaeon]|nr:class I SAM-dependent methyltransferase [Candidatus Woesearchaeota archaeon]
MVKKKNKLSAEEKNLAIAGSAKNYNNWMFSNLSRFIGKQVLEIGGGIGSMTQFLVKGRTVVSTDITDYNIRKLNARFRKQRIKGKFFAINTDISRTVSDVNRFRFDTVVCINVLEHIKNDRAALKNMHTVLDKGGRLVLLVPAFSRLYGTIDKSDSHYRRYDRKETVNQVRNAGFRIKNVFFMNMIGFFGWYYHGRILKAELHPSGDISLFDKLVPVFSFFEKIIKPPFGLSLIIIAEKNG